MRHQITQLALLLLLACTATAAAQSAPASAPAQVRPRIVSCSPLLTDLLFQIGLGDHVVGVTQFCRLPEGVHREVLSSREKVDTERMVGIRPDIVLIQQNPDDFKPLQRLLPGLRVEYFSIETLTDLDVAMIRIAALAGEPQAGEKAVTKFHADLDAVKQHVKGLSPRRIVFVSGVDPLMMVAGRNTFHDGMIALAGGVNVAAADFSGWKTISAEILMSLNPDVVVCQVLPGQEPQTAEFFGRLYMLPAVRNHKVFLVSDPRWTIASMYSANLTAELAEMAHGDRQGNDLPPPASRISTLWIAAAIGTAAVVLLAGGVLMALAGRRRRRIATADASEPLVPAAGGAGKTLDIHTLLTYLLLLAGTMLAVLLVCSLFGQVSMRAKEWDLSWEFRLGRLANAALVGAALASAGMALQGMLRNPLAEPYILGVSSGAGIGVMLSFVVASVLHVGAALSWLSMPVLAMAGALATSGAVYAIAQRRGRLDPYVLLLSGVIVNAFNGAIMLTLYLILPEKQIANFAMWAMGYISNAGGGLFLFSLAAVVLGWGGLLLRGASFNMLGLGDDVAASSGVHVHYLRVETFVLVSVMTAAAVALSGPIGFVGLIVPHICRAIVGPDHRRLALVCGFAGAMLLMIGETICNTVAPWLGMGILPVGILMALSGGPFFIYLLRKRRARVES